MSAKLMILLGLMLGALAYHGLTDLEARYAMEDRV